MAPHAEHDQETLGYPPGIQDRGLRGRRKDTQRRAPERYAAAAGRRRRRPVGDNWGKFAARLGVPRNY